MHRHFRSAAALATVALFATGAAACGSSDDSNSSTKASPKSTSTDSAMTDSSSTETTSTDTMSTDATSTGSGAAGGDSKTLQGDVGANDAFDISLQQGGSDVTKLAPGDYTIEINDESAIHNFHLTGPGVDETTDVQKVEKKTWKVTLKAGTYKFVCDPHVSSMSGSFTVA